MFRFYAFDKGIGFEYFSDFVEINFFADNFKELVQIWTEIVEKVHQVLYSKKHFADIEYILNHNFVIDYLNDKDLKFSIWNISEKLLQITFLELSTIINVELSYFSKRIELFEGNLDDFFEKLNNIVKKITNNE